MAEQNFDENDFSSYDNHETAKKLPIGWVLLAAGLILFGLYYFISYTPGISGWSQERAYHESSGK
ncbi:MAG: hypothetical protein LBH05_08465 [Deferribacteraceae bacterium]|jgi:hypothetical protein|nr:hypothetical protein [Deferribacteraceae bacterium]